MDLMKLIHSPEKRDLSTSALTRSRTLRLANHTANYVASASYTELLFSIARLRIFYSAHNQKAGQKFINK